MKKNKSINQKPIQIAVMSAVVGMSMAGSAVYAGQANPEPIVLAASNNPCSPCAPKANPCNPCQPAAAAANPCTPCNPCKPAAAVNPCNPCNPCAAKAPCNPCTPSATS